MHENVLNDNIDSATVYRNEEALGTILEEVFQDPAMGVSREDIFITSKLCKNGREREIISFH